MLVLGLLLTAVVGVALGSMGSGGSILALPILVYVFQLPPSTAVPMSLVLVATASGGATYLKWRQGCVSWRALVLMSSTGLAGAYWGSGLTHLVSPSVLMALFAALLLVVGTLMLSSAVTRLQPGQCRSSYCLTAGLLVGVLTGFLGVGGGFLLVPALVIFAGLDLKRAVGTSVGIISINSLAGVLGHLRFSDMNWRLTVLLLIAATLGMLLGASTAQRLPEPALRRGLAALMIVVGLSIGAAAIGSR